MISPMSLGVAEMNSGNHDMISAELSMRLIGPGHVTVPLTAVWSYGRQDPYAVRMALDTGEDAPVEWVLARDLLTAALHGRAGIGDVRAWPSAPPAYPGAAAGTGGKILNIVLGPPHGYACFHVDAADIEAFLGRTYEMVPAGEESDHLNLDAGLAELLSQA